MPHLSPFSWILIPFFVIFVFFMLICLIYFVNLRKIVFPCSENSEVKMNVWNW